MLNFDSVDLESNFNIYPTRFYKLTKNIYISLNSISYFENIVDTMNPDRKMIIYLNRSSSGDRITLNKEDSEKFLKFVEKNSLSDG